jgi:magnesium-transporting ATPase (P-type)
MSKDSKQAEFIVRDSAGIEISVKFGEKQRYKVLKQVNFTSDRRRSSVVLQNEQTNKYIAFVKGADTVIYDLLKDKNAPYVKEDFESVDFFAN